MRCSRSSPSVLEGLVHAEVPDLEAERVHPDELVRDVVAKHEIHLGDQRLTAAFVSGAGRVGHPLKCHRRLVWRLRQLAEADVLNDHVDLIGRPAATNISMPALLVLRDGGVGERLLEEQERVRVSSSTVARIRLKCLTTNCVRKYRISGA